MKPLTMASGSSPTPHVFLFIVKHFLLYTIMAQTVNVCSMLLNRSKRDFLAQNEAPTLPNFITPRMAWYNEFRAVCSIREYRSNVVETY